MYGAIQFTKPPERFTLPIVGCEGGRPRKPDGKKRTKGGGKHTKSPVVVMKNETGYKNLLEACHHAQGIYHKAAR